ncbi:MAG: glycoside hydrolase family 127 protein [Bacteroidaceae bacterium]|nr:glycoside hydrolase family 127 protein [Bacteroidaceae bacterium]
MRFLLTAAFAALTFSAQTSKAQSQLYPQHFDLSEVTLLDGQHKTMMEKNAQLLLEYDADRLMTPFVRQSGLSDISSSKYYGWTNAHPSFSNWGLKDWSLEGHVGGHYLTALALAYAALNDGSNEQNTLQKQIKEKLDYCVEIMKDCQDAYDNNTEGLYGFIGGQPINQIWTGLYANDLTEFKKYGGWVPFYCQHKILAGLRDAYLYAGNKTAKEAFKKLSDWSVNVVSKLSDKDMQTVLGWEHGGMNETLIDAYKIFGDTKYLQAAKKYSHKTMINGMKTFSATFLDGKHANTQVPKYIGFERIWQEYNNNSSLNASDVSDYRNSVLNFWDDVAHNRTVCIGGNSVSEHFVRHANGASYINNLDGPESCNSNNMLKLSEDLFDDTHDVKYADFYESTMYNHIMSTQDPQTGGYVYFTSLRPQSYRIYSQVNQGMWCCVGTGMENHSKYAHFAYTHSLDNDTLYVNLFIPSELKSSKFGVRQETNFPFEQKSTLTITKSGTYTLAIRKPSWVDGQGTYSCTTKKWKKGETINIDLPMSLRVEACPDYSDYVAVKYGPILLAAKTDTEETLQNEYGGEGRMDHAPGNRASIRTLSSSPLIIGERNAMLDSISIEDKNKLEFSLKTYNKGTITLEPFYNIHHSRYACYFYQATPEKYATSTMGQADALEQALLARQLDFVATGEQQSEAGHQASYSSGSTSGSYLGETYRDGKNGEYVQYVLDNTTGETTNVSLMLRFITADRNRAMTIYVDGTKIADFTVPASYKTADENGFFNVEFRIPDNLLVDANGKAKSKLTIKTVAASNTLLPGLYYMRLLKDYKENAYVWNCSDWTTGDAARVTQDKFTYNTNTNLLTVSSGTGVNNVCLSLIYTNCEYNISSSQNYLVVRGQNISTSSGKSYLWWLNGINKGTSVPPSFAKEITYNDENGDTHREQIIAWDMNQSGLNDNNSGETFSITQGQTILGLTSTTGTSTIRYIGFEASVDDYLDALSICPITFSTHSSTIYNIQGQQLHSTNISGIYIKGKKKFWKK